MKYVKYFCPRCAITNPLVRRELTATENSQPKCSCGAKMVKDEPLKRSKTKKGENEWGNSLTELF